MKRRELLKRGAGLALAGLAADKAYLSGAAGTRSIEFLQPPPLIGARTAFDPPADLPPRPKTSENGWEIFPYASTASGAA